MLYGVLRAFENGPSPSGQFWPWRELENNPGGRRKQPRIVTAAVFGRVGLKRCSGEHTHNCGHRPFVH